MHISAAPSRVLTRNRVPALPRRFQVCDFGLARGLSERMAVDRELVTLWYRVCVCACVCVRACVRVCVRACVRVCVVCVCRVGGRERECW